MTFTTIDYILTALIAFGGVAAFLLLVFIGALLISVARDVKKEVSPDLEERRRTAAAPRPLPGQMELMR